MAKLSDSINSNTQEYAVHKKFTKNVDINILKQKKPLIEIWSGFISIKQSIIQRQAIHPEYIQLVNVYVSDS